MSKESEVQYTDKLRILIAGGTSYTGRYLTEKLLEDENLSLRLLEWNPRRVEAKLSSRIELVKGNTDDPKIMDKACRNVHTAYYIVNFIDSGSELEKLNLNVARRFRDSCIKNGVRRIIYSSDTPPSSTVPAKYHSRRKIGEILCEYPEKIQTLWLRNGIVLGSGSLNFEILNALTEKKTLFIFGWMKKPVAVIGIDDLAEILVNSKDLSVTGNRSIDLYTEAESYNNLLKIIENKKNKKRKRLKLRMNHKLLSAAYLTLHTPVNFSIARELIERIISPFEKSESLKKFFTDTDFLPPEYSITKALVEIEQKTETCRWCDSYSDIKNRIGDEDSIPPKTLFDRREIDFKELPAEAVFSSVLDTGGANGWFTYTLLWRLRGLMDKFAGGYGLKLGKRNSRDLRIGDSIDVWKIADIITNKRLLLYAQMKLPGKGWLEFRIEGSKFIQTAYFQPNGITGRLYWLAMLPFHGLIFNDMTRKIIERAEQKARWI